MSEYNFQCACCLKWYNVGDTGPRPTKAELAKMVCQSCKTAPKGLAAAEARVRKLEAERGEDTKLLDYLQEEIVDTIYLDDGRIIDVRGDCLRSAIREAMKGGA